MKSTFLLPFSFVFLSVLALSSALPAEKIQPGEENESARPAADLETPVLHQEDSGKTEDHDADNGIVDEQSVPFKTGLISDDNSDPDHFKVHSLTDGEEQAPGFSRQFDDFRHGRGRFNDCPFDSFHGCRRFFDCPFDNPWQCFNGGGPRFFGGPPPPPRFFGQGPRGPFGPRFGGGGGPHFGGGGGPHFGGGGPGRGGHFRRQEEGETKPEDAEETDPDQPEPHPFKDEFENDEKKPTGIELTDPNLKPQTQGTGVHVEEPSNAEQPDKKKPAEGEDKTHEAKSFYTYSK